MSAHPTHLTSGCCITGLQRLWTTLSTKNNQGQLRNPCGSTQCTKAACGSMRLHNLSMVSDLSDTLTAGREPSFSRAVNTYRALLLHGLKQCAVGLPQSKNILKNGTPHSFPARKKSHHHFEMTVSSISEVWKLL
jgi:hypothetical protein